MDPEKTLKDSNVTHLSTWIIITDPALSTLLSQYTGEDVQPIALKLRLFGEEIMFNVYTNMLIEELMVKISDISTIPLPSLSLKVFEGNIIKRLDKNIFNIDNPSKKNTIKDLKLTETTPILVEMKTDEEIKKDEEKEIKLLG